jgi:hypothetical protein
MKTLSRAYDTHAQARNAVASVEAAGIPTGDVSLVANKHVSDKYADVGETKASEGAGAGAGIGGAVGGGAGLLAGLGLLAIPGLGPVVAAGWLAALAVGAVAGAATGGLAGALIGSGISEDHANVYSESVRRGGTLVSVRVEDSQASRIAAILDQYDPIDPDQRGADYRKDGWTTFDPKAPAYLPNQTELERMRREDRAA